MGRLAAKSPEANQKNTGLEATGSPVAQVSRAQKGVLMALSILTADGWPASVREIMAATGHASTSTVHAHLENLERVGLIAKHPRNDRGGWRLA